jgi:uncharacterized protein (TIGR02001 family)
MAHNFIRSLLAAGALSVSALAAAAADLPARTAPKVLPPAAAAPESTPIDFVVGAKWMTDYNFRGISQSNRDPSAMAYGEVQLFDNFLYAGLAAYRVDLATKPSAEVDITAGIRPKFGPFTFDLGITYYYYPGERALIGPDTTIYTVRNTDFLEYGGKVTYAATDDLSLTGGAYHTHNWLGSHANGTYAFGQVKQNIPEGALGFMPAGFSVSGEVGRYFLGTSTTQFPGSNIIAGTLGSPFKLKSYTYFNVGASYTWEVFTVDVRYHATDLSKKDCFTNTGDPRGIYTGSGRSNWCGDAVIATLSMELQGSKLPGIFAPK